MCGHAQMVVNGLAVRAWCRQAHPLRLDAHLRRDPCAQCVPHVRGQPVAAMIAWHTRQAPNVLRSVVHGLGASASQRIQRLGSHAQALTQRSQVRWVVARWQSPWADGRPVGPGVTGNRTATPTMMAGSISTAILAA